MRPYAFAVYVLATGSLLAACGASTRIKDTEAITPDTHVVYGSAEVWTDEGKEKWGVGWTGESYFHLMILPEDSNEAFNYRVDKDGQFYWALEPGAYRMLGYVWQDANEKRSGDIEATFVVPDEGGDQYLGALEFRGNELMLKPAIIDRFDSARVSYDQRFPTRAGQSIKSLMVFEPPIGNFASISGQCNECWLIDCSKRYSGVTPLSPDVASQGFPDIDTLSPEFSWTASPKEGVTYDLVVYEAAVYRLDSITQSYVKGRRVSYVEDIAGTSYRLAEPLKPDTKYYWSVRFREGDHVSRWSTHSHFTFALVYVSSGYGQWFQFETPAG